MDKNDQLDLLAGMQYLARKDSEGRLTVESDVIVDWMVGSRSSVPDRANVRASLERLAAAGRIEFDHDANIVRIVQPR